MDHNANFQLGLLHLIHLLVNVDGHIDDRERAAMERIRKEENIPDSMFHEFEQKVTSDSEDNIYTSGIDYLMKCSEEERLAAFVHLYKLAEADTNISSKEVRFLFYGLKTNRISFEDVILSADMSGKQT